MRCQVCGCTDDRACMTDHGPCHWACKVPPICSGCAPLVSILCKQLYKEPFSIIAGKRLVEDLGADEIDRVEIVMAIEGVYKIYVSPRDYNAFATVGELIELVHQIQASARAA